MNRHVSYFVALFGCITLAGCQTVGPGAATGGAFGTFAGSVTGAAIGAKDGKAGEGALIGALTGGTLGSIAGNAVDQQIQRDRIEIQNGIEERRSSAVSISQVVQMTHSGLASDVIARQIQNQGVLHRPSIDDLIVLKNQGVDDNVIQAFQNAPTAGEASYVSQPVEVVRQPVLYEAMYSYRIPVRIPLSKTKMRTTGRNFIELLSWPSETSPKRERVLLDKSHSFPL